MTIQSYPNKFNPNPKNPNNIQNIRNNTSKQINKNKITINLKIPQIYKLYKIYNNTYQIKKNTNPPFKQAMSQKQQTIYINTNQQQCQYNDNQYPSYQQQQNNIEHDIQNSKLDNQQIDELLDNEQETKKQMILKFKINELQKICNSLTNTNKKLIDKLTRLEQQKQAQQYNKNKQKQQNKQQQIFVDEYSQLNTQFIQVQNLIHQYKKSLQSFQQNGLKDMKNKQQKLIKLKVQVKQLTDRYNQLFLEKEDMEKINKQLQTRNQGLILEIQNLEKQKIRFEDKINFKPQFSQHSSRYDLHHNQYDIPSEIQNQYEIIIDKLVKELEYQKNIKKKMNDQIKRLAQQLIESQKQIMNKNKKLYQMEMKLLKSSKATADSVNNYSKFRYQENKNNGHSSYYAQHQATPKKISREKKVEQRLNFKTFVLLELINGELDEQVSSAQRRIVGIKIIQFYQRKIERQDYSNVMPQNILIVNFNHKKPQLLSIRKVGTSVYEQGQKTQQSLVWNLAFILDNLFGQNQDVQEFDEILELTGQTLQKKVSNSRQTLQYMKEILSL